MAPPCGHTSPDSPGSAVLPSPKGGRLPSYLDLPEGGAEVSAVWESQSTPFVPPTVSLALLSSKPIVPAPPFPPPFPFTLSIACFFLFVFLLLLLRLLFILLLFLLGSFPPCQFEPMPMVFSVHNLYGGRRRDTIKKKKGLCQCAFIR